MGIVRGTKNYTGVKIMNMKKIIAVVLSAAAVLSLAGCGNKETSTPTSALTSNTSSTLSSAGSTSTADGTSSAANGTSSAANSSSAANGTSSVPQSSKTEESSVPEEDPNAALFSFREQEDGTIMITGYKGDSFEVTIPETLNGKKVTALNGIGGGMETLVIPDSVTKIDDQAFTGCAYLKNITFPKNFEIINPTRYFADGTPWRTAKQSENTFFIVGQYLIDGHNCSGKVEIPAGVKEIAGAAFNCNDHITDVVLPKGLTKIGNGAFQSCEGLTEAVMQDGLAEIGPQAFSGGCYSLTKVVMPDSVTMIGYGAFMDCKRLTDVTFPNNAVIVDDAAFHDCPWFTNLKGDGMFKTVNGNILGLDKNSPDYKAAKESGFVVPDGTRTAILKDIYVANGMTVALPDSLEYISNVYGLPGGSYIITYKGEKYRSEDQQKVIDLINGTETNQ